MVSSTLIIGTRGSRLALVQAHFGGQGPWKRADDGPGRTGARPQDEGRHGQETPPWTPSAERASSSRNSNGPWSRERSTRPYTASRTCLRPFPTAWTIAAVPERVDVRDALISRDGAGLDRAPSAAPVSPRGVRRRQVAAAALQAGSALHGYPRKHRYPVEAKLEEPDGPDAIVLAVAGLQRLGWSDRISEVLSPDVCMPAVGQAALALETRKDDRPNLEAARRIEHLPARQAVMAERSFLSRIGGGCHTPVGAWGRIRGDYLELDAVLAAEDGSWVVRHSLRGQPEEGPELGRRLAEAVLAQATRAKRSTESR